MNYKSNPYRRVDLTAQLAHGVDPLDAMADLKARLARIPNVLATPAPEVEILEFNAAGTKLVVRPFCHNDHYWQVYFDANKVMLAAAGERSWPVPASHRSCGRCTTTPGRPGPGLPGPGSRRRIGGRTSRSAGARPRRHRAERRHSPGGPATGRRPKREIASRERSTWACVCREVASSRGPA